MSTRFRKYVYAFANQLALRARRPYDDFPPPGPGARTPSAPLPHPFDHQDDAERGGSGSRGDVRCQGPSGGRGPVGEEAHRMRATPPQNLRTNLRLTRTFWHVRPNCPYCAPYCP
ncbi:hypothetical protein GCM10012286_59370 [Streptomyces lasiicapitis]|uniref:Uncharacterized protein n=1 Tax=Streptomyces lasiicapitis TaxID=1923961 RepID=A0ABQ2MJQ5_9ACTN|nr:hypothetical protein GCM10012286_59370 [Streptomyces lasiicapitis]